MKKKLHFLKLAVRLMAIALCTVPALYSCGDDPVPAQITMVTDQARLVFYLVGSGEASINWGDGSAPETHSLSTVGINCSHEYSGATAHTVRIYGEGITFLSCINNSVTALDVSKNTALTGLSCYNNQFTVLDVSKNTALETLYCDYNQLTVLDVSSNTALETLYCHYNQLTVLDVSRNTVLTNLDCKFNQLTALDVSNNTALKFLNCRENQLSAESLNAMFGTLHANPVTGKAVYIGNNPGTSGCNRSIATAKGWTVLD